MAFSEKFCLKWNDFQANISSSYQDLRKEQDFSDVTLACEGDQTIKAHKVILAGCSSVFSKLLKQHNHPHPLLYMRGMTTQNLTAVVDFIYHGEVNIFQEDLDVFLVIAEELQLKGLSGAEQGPKNFDQPSRTEPKFKEKTNDKEPPQAMPKTELVNWPLQKEETLQEMSLKTAIVPVDVARTNTSYEDLDATINSMIEVTGSKLWTCKECGKT